MGLRRPWAAAFAWGLLAGGCAGAPAATPSAAPAAAAVADSAEPAPEADSASIAPVGNLHLVLNVPAYRLDVLEGEGRVASYPVAVGLPQHPTPPGHYEIDRITWNPWWYPPDREWAAEAEITPPCPQNPMGRVKIFFRELYFIHGTPDAESVGTAASHGCVRMLNVHALELARRLARKAAPSLAEQEILQLERNPKRTRTVLLDRTVPVEVRYDLVEVRDGNLWMYPDVYGRCRIPYVDQALSALSAAGYRAADAWGSRLEELAARAETDAVSLPVEQILRGAPGSSAGLPDTD